MTIDAVVLAGGLLKGRICLWKFNKKPVIVHVLEKLVASTNVGKIAVVGSRRLEEVINLFPGNNVVYCPEGKNIVDNAEIGAKVLGSYDKYCLFIAADLPLLETEHVDSFVEQTRPHFAEQAKPDFPSYDFFYSIVNDVLLRRYETQGVIKRRYVRTTDENFVAGNMMICNPCKLKNTSLVKRAYEYRNIRYFGNKLMWCILFPGVVTRFLWGYYILRNISFDYINSELSNAFGTRFKLVPLDYAEPSIDVDNALDCFRIRRYLMNKE